MDLFSVQPDVQVIEINNNYRSTRNIVEFSRDLMHSQTILPHRELATSNIIGPKIVARQFSSDVNQYLIIAQEIYGFVKRSCGLLRFSDFAILARTNMELKEMRKALEFQDVGTSEPQSDAMTAEDPKLFIRENGVDDGILVSTVHAAKGTEAAFVYVLNMEEGEFSLALMH